jgi:hypothetical protein
MNFDVKSVVAVGTCAYGVGTTLKEAERNLKREDRTARVRAYRLYSCERSALRFECGVSLTIFAPPDAACARLEVLP